MKKITKTFYIPLSDLEFILKQDVKKADVTLYGNTEIPINSGAIEITFSVPEKKIEITESQFFDMFKHDNDEFVYSYDQLKQKLFGESHDY